MCNNEATEARIAQLEEELGDLRIDLDKAKQTADKANNTLRGIMEALLGGLGYGSVESIAHNAYQQGFASAVNASNTGENGEMAHSRGYRKGYDEGYAAGSDVDAKAMQDKYDLGYSDATKAFKNQIEDMRARIGDLSDKLASSKSVDIAATVQAAKEQGYTAGYNECKKMHNIGEEGK